MGCGGADGTRDCGYGAAKAADDGEQDCGGAPATVFRWRRSRGRETQPRERVNKVEEDSRTCCENKKGVGELEQLLAVRRRAWRLRVPAVRRGGAGRGQQGSGERRAGDLEGQVVRLKRRGAAGSARARRRGAAGCGAEQQRKQRGRGERNMMRTWLEFFKSARTPL
jgi:hypothetical protein